MTARPLTVAAPPLRPKVQIGEIEAHCQLLGRWPLLGADEVGRGPLAGPVVAAAVVLRDSAALGDELAGLDDSKKLTEAQREALVPRIGAAALAFAVEEGSLDEIAAHNILGASLRAMARAAVRVCEQLRELGLPAPALWVIDGNQPLREPLAPAQMAVVQGDGRSRTIAAASVLAKVHRDRLMVRLDDQHPGYGLGQHKGYPTPQHLAALQLLGPSPVHRLGYGPVAQAARQQALFG